MDQNLLNILCCPETKQTLSLAESGFIDVINAKIKEGSLTNRTGDVVQENVEAALIREDKQWAYLVRQDIPIMLIDEAIEVSAIQQ